MSDLPEGMQELLDKLSVIKKELEIHNLRGSVLNDKRSALELAIKEICPHPQEYLKNEYSYFSGSYYDRASTDHWTTCTLCGARSEIRTETHSYYG